jgi:hypothetical protein
MLFARSDLMATLPTSNAVLAEHDESRDFAMLIRW